MKLIIEARSDVGRVRELNEDSYALVPEGNTVIVCDGMGGHAAGEVASATAAQTIADLVKGQPAQIVDLLASGAASPLPKDAAALALAVRIANRRVYNAAARSHKLRGMGTTVAAASFSNGMVATAHVGDSRVYRIAGGKIQQLTTDHSWIAELVQSGQVKPEDADSFADKNVITRALGTRPNVQVDVGLYPVAAGEVYLLCSDGLCGYVSDAEILSVVMKHQDDIAGAANALIALANAAGGLDNSTVAVIRIVDQDTKTTNFEEGAFTLPEESEVELASMDDFIVQRFGADEAPPPRSPSVLEPPTATGKEEAAPASDSEEVAAKARRGFPLGWAFLVAILGLTAIIMLWPRLIAPPVEVVGEGLIYLAAQGENRESKVYWDDVYQGNVADLEAGLLVPAGLHRLVVVSQDGVTLLDSTIAVSPSDTLDFKVR